MGLGHVPQEPLRAQGAGAELQGRQRRGTADGRAVGPPTGGANGGRGRFGEDLAARWYEREGYAVLARNWRCAEGEIDLVAGRPGLIVVCEVKARSSARFGLPAEAVTWRKQQRLRRLAAIWLAAHPHARVTVRFDVACVLGTDLQIIQSAF